VIGAKERGLVSILSSSEAGESTAVSNKLREHAVALVMTMASTTMVVFFNIPYIP
jgi:hypothetical protein